MIRKSFVVSGMIAALGLVSCADPNAPRKSVSIGRMGVMNVAPAADGSVAQVPGGAPADPNAAAQAAPSPTIAKPARNRVSPEVETPVAKPGPADGIRLPNMLGLPEERDLKASNPSVPKSGDEGGPVISRPPVEKKD